MPRDLIEPEGVNAESEAKGRTGDPVPGGDPAAGPEEQEPAGEVLAAPTTEDSYGS